MERPGMKHDLRKVADTLLEVARPWLVKTKSSPVLVAFGLPDGTLEHIQLSDEMANRAMSSGRTKDLFFGLIRDMAQSVDATVVAISTEGWAARSTPAAQAIPETEFRRLSSLNDGFEALLSMGLVERREVIQVTVQDVDEVLNLTQAFQRQEDGTPYDLAEPEEQRMPQSGYEGRTKMFGKLTEETTR